MHGRIIGGNGLGHLLQKRRFSCLGRRHNHASLSLSDGRQQVHHPHGCRIFPSAHLQAQSLVGENRRQIFEIGTAFRSIRGIAVDGSDVKKGCKFLRCRLHSPASADNIACFHVKPADLGRRHINVILSGKEILTANKAEAIRHHLQDSVGLDAAVQFL